MSAAAGPQAPLFYQLRHQAARYRQSKRNRRLGYAGLAKDRDKVIREVFTGGLVGRKTTCRQWVSEWRICNRQRRCSLKWAASMCTN